MNEPMADTPQPQAKSPWIPVSEGLPQPLEKCLVVTKEEILIAIYFYGKWGYFGHDWGEVTPGNLIDIPNGSITHWMPLPERPE